MSVIIFAGYGVWNAVNDVTATVRGQYSSGLRDFRADYIAYGDPFPGGKKYLFIVWKEGELTKSGLVGDSDDHLIHVP